MLGLCNTDQGFDSFSLDWGSNYCIIRDFDFANKDELLSMMECKFWKLVWFSACVTANMSSILARAN